MVPIRSTTLLLLVVAGATMAYVSPDDQGVSKAEPGGLMIESRTMRPKPKPMAPQEAAPQVVAMAPETSRRKRGPHRKSRGVGNSAGAGSFASSGAGSFSGSGGNYQGASSGNNPSGFGYAGQTSGGNPFPSFPFHNPNPVGVMPFDFSSLFQYLQQMQQQFQQNAINQGLPNSYGVASRDGVFGPNGFSKVSSRSYSNNGIGGGGMENFNSYMGGGMGYSDGASAVASIGPQGGYGSANLIPDLGTRFGSDSGQLPPPSGGNVGVFTSSSSGTSDVNGQRTSYKIATSGINDNGKITTFTVRDPPQK